MPAAISGTCVTLFPACIALCCVLPANVSYMTHISALQLSCMCCRQTTSFYVPVWFLCSLRFFTALYFAAELLIERYTTRALLNTPPCSDCGYRYLSGGELSAILAIVTSSTSHSSTR